MSDFRIVQCYGIKVRPHKQAKYCNRRFRWVARGTHGNFGRKGTQACPHCGNLPDFAHPMNRYLNDEITGEEAQRTIAQDYDEHGRYKKT